MTIAELLLPEFDSEIAVTRRVLERVPDDKSDWKPHAKSFPMSHLAQLVSRLPGWTVMIMSGTEADIAPTDGGSFPGYSVEKTAKLIEEFNNNAKAARNLIAGASDADFEVAWTLKKAGQVLATQSRYLAIRSMVLNHLVHHRAQLGVYLRMVEVPVPSMYGPTADEN